MLWLQVSNLLRYIFFACFFISCGYVPRDQEVEIVTSISIDEIKGDREGFLARFLQQELLNEGIAGGRERNCILHIEILDTSRDQIGFRYDVNPSTQALTKRLVSNEERTELRAKIWIEQNGRLLLEPMILTGQSQYDFVDPDAVGDVTITDQNGQTVSALSYSLGQLDSLQGARETAKMVSARCLAKQIAATVSLTLFDKSR